MKHTQEYFGYLTAAGAMARKSRAEHEGDPKPVYGRLLSELVTCTYGRRGRQHELFLNSQPPH